MQLLKAELLEQVQRGTEADDIRQKYAEKVDFGGYVVQSLLLREIGL